MKASNLFWDGALPTASFGRLIVFGATGAGKSTFGATMPGPRFIIAADPNAAVPLHRTFDDLPREYLPPTEKNRRPVGYATVDTFSEVMDAVSLLEREGPSRGIQSVIVDSLTSVSELCSYEIMGKKRGQAMEGKLSIPDYGNLFVKLDTLRHRLHQLPMHVLWLAGTKRVRNNPFNNNAQSTEEPPRMEGPDLMGQSAERVPANCQASLFIERYIENGKTRARLRTQPDGEVVAKDNTGTLSRYEVADAYVVLSKMGFIEPIQTDKVVAVSAASSGPSKKSGLIL